MPAAFLATCPLTLPIETFLLLSLLPKDPSLGVSLSLLLFLFRTLIMILPALHLRGVVSRSTRG